MVQIEKLDEKNYDSWSIKMRSVLIHSGSWRIVNGTTKKEGSAAEVAKWETDDEKALASIYLSVKPTQLGYIRNCTTSHEAWKKLEEVYMPRGPLQKVSLYKRLINLKMQENGDIVQHMNEFSELCEKLNGTGIEIKEELLTIMLMTSLPREYDNFVVAMETRDELPSISSLKQKLLEEGKRRREKVVEKTSSQQAFTAKNARTKNDNRRPNNSNKKFKGKCCIYGIAGHFASKCARKNSSNDKTQAMTMLAVAEAEALNKKDGTLTVVLLHTCATPTTCLSIFTHTHSEKITLAGNKHIEAVGKGDVSIYNKEYEITLENVLYSPELQANFISVSKAVDRGLTVHFDKKRASIRRADGDIVLQAMRRSNMFVFDNKVKEGLFAMRSNGNLAWHNRYGHLNFKSLYDLSNKGMVNGMKINSDSETNCRTCMLSKIHVLPFPTSHRRSPRDCWNLNMPTFAVYLEYVRLKDRNIL